MANVTNPRAHWFGARALSCDTPGVRASKRLGPSVVPSEKTTLQKRRPGPSCDPAGPAQTLTSATANSFPAPGVSKGDGLGTGWLSERTVILATPPACSTSSA